jgi:carbon-monoxide dehydrogenase large subunit
VDADATMAAARAFPSGAHVAEVEIDPATGETRVVAYTAVDDCGRVLDATLVDGQLHGGLAQWRRAGARRARRLRRGQRPAADRQLHGLRDAARGLAAAVDRAAPPGAVAEQSLGAKGAGEAGTTGALPALANAILDALAPAGVTALQLPASPHRVWRALRDATTRR